MSIAANVDARIQTVSVTEDTITAQLVDGRTISVPLAWSWRLSEATPEQRATFEIIGSGSGKVPSSGSDPQGLPGMGREGHQCKCPSRNSLPRLGACRAFSTTGDAADGCSGL